MHGGQRRGCSAGLQGFAVMRAFDEGYDCGGRGLEAWMNPYTNGSDLQDDFLAWFAGWCKGRRVMYDIEKKRAGEFFGDKK